MKRQGQNKIQSKSLSLQKHSKKIRGFQLFPNTINVNLYLTNRTINIPVSLYTSFSSIHMLLMSRLFVKEKKKTAGFSSLNHNYPLDYQLQRKLGEASSDLKLRIFQKKNQLTGVQKYKVCNCLAVGGFSKVFLLRSWADGEFYAGKYIEKDKLVEGKQSKDYLFRNQRKIHEKIDHPFIVKLHQFIETEKFYIFIMDYCPGGQLFYLLRRYSTFNEDEARFYFIEILLALEYLHEENILYRDLKPQNILLDANGHIKVADFGLAKISKQRTFSYCGSLEYMAPEIITGIGHTKTVDFYCLGALLFEMLIGFPPFYDPSLSQQQTKHRILHYPVQFPSCLSLSSEVKDLILKLTEKSEKLRLGNYSGAKQILAHPWIGKVDRSAYIENKVKAPFQPNLSENNFNKEQIGESERLFQKKIDRELKHIKLKDRQKKSTGTKKRCETLTQFKNKRLSPYIRNPSKEVFVNYPLNKNSHHKKSPYDNIVVRKRPVTWKWASFQRMKTENGMPQKRGYKTKLTQYDKQNYSNIISKLKKKGKVVFLNHESKK